MHKKLFSDIPEYVKITIYAQTRRLLCTSHFIRDNDLEDIIQDLLLYYLERFYKRHIPSEPYVVVSLQNEAKKLIRTKVRKRFGLFLSLDDVDYDLNISNSKDDFDGNEMNLIISTMTKHLSEHENMIIQMILEGQTIESISKQFHISKNTIYKLFERIKNICKK